MVIRRSIIRRWAGGGRGCSSSSSSSMITTRVWSVLAIILVMGMLNINTSTSSSSSIMPEMSSSLSSSSVANDSSTRSSSSLPAGAVVSAMFAFGDSLTDPGNNNYLNSLAKANYVPYGVDFFQGPSGRFSNGRTTIDFLGDLLNLPLLPAYASPYATGKNLLRGVNYASASAGILDETGQNLGERFSFSQQVENFESNLNELKKEMGGGSESDDDQELLLKQYLSKSIAVLVLGSNDYINNYLLTSSYATSQLYTPTDYAHLLINHYTRQILALHSLGLKKFLVAGIGPLGCIPNQIASSAAGAPPVPGECVSLVNHMAELFNTRLLELIDQLNTNYSNDAIFVYGNTYGTFTEILDNSTSYGFTDKESGCCGLGRKKGEISCLPFSVPCTDRKQHVFWDAFHPTEAVNQILAQRAFYGPPSDSFPINVQQLAQL